ncbi:MAG: hypothetical protein UU64_C0007G0044 [candidate division WWE3 bacterium GW2011_GWF2_41_45]|uniref:UVR domain-containing protein n=3 Tax=Katanobacteria TaxID=422282 RepID=A0A1F4VZD8_UNCKA|nr:MAG: hypothetical protein UU55_C0008G0012 [candidate division WWE3 bacterium GW2011_GWC2_41_23]KKS10231.1 MAG: hypothetical protein UU64_C0007G0044 [candidate division WWE3 bacterium GW2011_GWF2_41_45]KKS19973.1 MAG: hypothetical protein UU79_C0006G0012 [candidate division WWE3 bacterium GW2011_GWE1_41_72]KKS28210.1 MAG: hypothetical protein UU86_C0008G0009 [candidate division WWE3 bacterium GW2011_GWC1_42_102]KKS29129.1 MAG: hypothetical protein UU90_C0012G0012 [candidate division WWE3 bact
MKWLSFLHFYQPADQQRDILEAVVSQSYLPVLKTINASKFGSQSINISGSLLELLDNSGYHELLDMFKKSLEEGKIELTGSCKYHSFIPLVPEAEVYRQIVKNEETLEFYFGNGFKKAGFFPPEMAYSEFLPGMLEELGYKWLILDEIAYNKEEVFPSGNSLYRIKDSNLAVFFRNRRLSNLVMSAVVRSKETLDPAIKDMLPNKYVVTGMDGETFGHHRPGLESLLGEIINSEEPYSTMSISEFLNNNSRGLPVETVTPRESTWASSPEDIERGSQFLSWLDTSNPIHGYQWDFFKFVLDLFYKIPESSENYDMLKSKMDIAMSSDHFWWASAKPWWSLEMIEQGAFRFLDIIKSLPGISENDVSTAQKYYQLIVSTAFEWQRTGKVRQMAKEQNEATRIPFKERTYDKGGHQKGVWEAFIHLIQEEEKKAVKNREYEKAVLWRDALFKLENKLDIYDMINAIDLLRLEIGNDEVEKTLNKYTEKYHKIRGGQPEQRG